jgi:hypothetical protein
MKENVLISIVECGALVTLKNLVFTESVQRKNEGPNVFSKIELKIQLAGLLTSLLAGMLKRILT